eukprot:2303929-Pyramimonas_sp.AAC.1
MERVVNEQSGLLKQIRATGKLDELNRELVAIADEAWIRTSRRSPLYTESRLAHIDQMKQFLVI